ncbi:MAG: hypothetical protein GX369_01020 [Euryarchaeota archaeon]|nr:hypothetical protein [Euryarchaeota archaeon]
MLHRSSKELITRGNIDGIISAAIFLRCYPHSKIQFVTSPAAAAPYVQSSDADHIFVSDLSPVPSLAGAIESILYSRQVTLIDHHPFSNQFDWAVIDDTASAAGLMHRILEPNGMDAAVAIADLYESGNGSPTQHAGRILDVDSIAKECDILDFAWRFNIKDDIFRYNAASQLARDNLPSEIPCIVKRYEEMIRQNRWGKAINNAYKHMQHVGNAAIIKFDGRRPSFYGFGTRALTEAARRKGCNYVAMLYQRKSESVVSLRSTMSEGENLGQFIESFTSRHGIEGGGHPNSAGARIPTSSTNLLINKLSMLA